MALDSAALRSILTTSPRRRLGPHGHSSGDAVQPGTERVMNPELMRFAEEHEERRLKGVLGVVRIAQKSSADAEDHRPVPFDQGSERELGGLVIASPMAKRSSSWRSERSPIAPR